jgi:ankyrin repeat protein
LDEYLAIPRDAIVDNTAAMMTVDAAMMSDEAVFYLLPVLARSALFGSSDPYLLSLRLERLDRSSLSAAQHSALDALLAELRAFDAELEQLEASAITEGRELWRKRLSGSPDPNHRLLLAADAGDLKGITEALAAGADAEYADELGNSAQRIAELYGHTAIVEVLLSHRRR